MAAQLTEGATYLVKATTTNMSTKAGVPVAAPLTVNIAAVVNSQVIMEDSKVYGFAAEETHTFEFSMAVPMGTGGKAGEVVAEVLGPNGNKLADGSLGIAVIPIIQVLTVRIKDPGLLWDHLTYQPTHWRFVIYDKNSNLIGGLFPGIYETATFSNGWEFPLKFDLNIFHVVDPAFGYTLYSAQSIDPGAPAYTGVTIPGYGDYYYNISTGQFERIK